MNVARQATKKPTCVGFFVGQNLLISLQAQQPEQQPEQQQVPRQLQEPVQVQLQEQVQQPEPALVQQPELQFCHRRLRTGPTMQQPEQSISFTFLYYLMTTQKTKKFSPPQLMLQRRRGILSTFRKNAKFFRGYSPRVVAESAG